MAKISPFPEKKVIFFIENLPIHFQPYEQHQALLALFLLENLPVKTLVRLTCDDLELPVLRVPSLMRFVSLKPVTLSYLHVFLSERKRLSPKHKNLFSQSDFTPLSSRILYRYLHQMRAYAFLKHVSR